LDALGRCTHTKINPLFRKKELGEFYAPVKEKNCDLLSYSESPGKYKR
jgi:hypothetical protein